MSRTLSRSREMNKVTVGHPDIRGRTISAKGNTDVRRPEMGLWLTCLRDTMEASVAGVE